MRNPDQNPVVMSIIVLALLLLPILAQTQEANHQTENLLQKANTFFAQGDYKAAKGAFKQALKLDKDLLAAYAGLGKIAYEENDWGDLKGSFGEILKRDPDNFEAHYYRGIGYRESGKHKALLLRKLDFNKAKDNFGWIVSRDSLYRDVLFQWAVLKRHRDNYTEAIELGQKQVRLRPELSHAQTGLYGLYRNFIRHKGKQEVLTWLEHQSWPRAHYFMGEVHRRESNLEDAESIILDLLQQDSALSRQPIYLSLVRIFYEQNRTEHAEEYFRRAVNEIKTKHDAEMVLEDVKYVMTNDELRQFHNLETSAEYSAFFHSVWVKRDPFPAAKTNARLAEHYRRLNYVENDYEFDGVRSWFNNPDKLTQLEFPKVYYLNQDFNDKGLIYIRHGQPNDRAVTLGQSVTPNESWLYYETSESPEIIFHFLLDANATENNWRLTPFVSHPEMLSDRVSWGSIYHQMLTGSQLERFGLESRMAEESRESVNIGFSTDRHSFDKSIEPLSASFYSAAFRGDNGQTMLEIYCGFPIFQISQNLPENSREAQVEMGLAIHDLNWQLRAEQLDTLFLPFDPEELRARDLIIDLLKATIPPDSYHVAFHINPYDTELFAGANFDMNVPRFSYSGLQLSDIQLAFTVEPAEREGKFTKNGLKVVPNPSRNFPRDKPVNVYFEIYNLELDNEGKTEFAIEYTLTSVKKKRRGLKKLFGIFGGGKKSSISLRSDRTGSTAFSAEFLSFDVENVDKGDYQFTVKIMDKNSQDSAVRQSSVVLY
jgi:tetratricopeptide (TPR) repeat protein